jgi:serine/threonine protein kinase
MKASRSESSTNVIRVNATSIDVSSSNTIAFGYAGELARAGRVIAGRHRLERPLPDLAYAGVAAHWALASSRAVAPASFTSSASRAAGLGKSGAAGRGGALGKGEPGRAHGAGVVSGRVWSAESLWDGSLVLVELLDPAIAEDPGLADAFEWEVRAAAAVTSPFVNRVLDFGIECNTPYLVTEMPYGVSLAARLRAGKRPSQLELERILHELGHALDQMHDRGFIHRDLRSERVFAYRPSRLAAREANGRTRGESAHPEREVVTLSFGISKLMNDTLELVRTMARRPVTPADTPQYTSPEQVLGTSPVGPRSDLWSLAVIAFECLTGEMPFDGKTTGERLVQICTGEPRVPSSIAAVPRGFDAWFARGVQKDPEQRFGSAREMAEAYAGLVSC